MSKAKQAYNKLLAHVRETAVLGSCASLLHWDKETYLPPGGNAHRAEQLRLLAGLCHSRATAPEIGDWLTVCEKSKLVADPVCDAAVNVREIRRRYDRKLDMPLRLVEELAHVTATAHPHWVEARRTGDFGLFQPWLEQILALKREEAEAVGYREHPYDALLDEFEPGETTARVRTLFDELQPHLVDLIDAARGRIDADFRTGLPGTYPVPTQQALCRRIGETLGFDFAAGRIDTVVHPFCSCIGPGDTRVAMRYEEDRFLEGVFGMIHETGHGLYDQGLPDAAFGTPLGEPVSYAIHESQSRLWENMVGRGEAFWRHFLPQAKEHFPDALGMIDLPDFLQACNTVKPSFIRVEADELTYNLHIILRFEIEEALLAGALQVADVPAAWHEKFKNLLDLDVPDHSQGCLQDVHWSFGGIGYFPFYALGNLYAAQFYAAARAAIPGLEESFAKGDFAPLLTWLRNHIHLHGKRFRARELVERVSGNALGTTALIAHLKDRYGRVDKTD